MMVHATDCSLLGKPLSSMIHARSARAAVSGSTISRSWPTLPSGQARHDKMHTTGVGRVRADRLRGHRSTLLRSPQDQAGAIIAQRAIRSACPHAQSFYIAEIVRRRASLSDSDTVAR